MANKQKLIGVIDMTPTWESLMPGLMAVLESGTEKGRMIARKELMRLAKHVDKLNKGETP